MKKTLLSILLLIALIVPARADAALTPVSVMRDTVAGFIRPLSLIDYIKAPFFVATSTTSSVFPNASSSNFTVSGNTYLTGLSNGCLELSSGRITSTGSNCGTGGGGITSLNSQTGSSQTFATTTGGTVFTIGSSGDVHTFTFPDSPTFTSLTASSRLAVATTTFNSGFGVNIATSTQIRGSSMADLGGLSGHVFTGFGAGSTVTLNNFFGAALAVVGNTTLTGNTTNSGTLLVGTTTPTNKLFVQGAGGANPFVVASSTGSTMMSLSQAGVLNLSALSDGCLQASSGDITSTGSACGSGGGGSNWTIMSGGLRTSTTTDFARAAYFVATSTTATSTFAGAVGIGTSSPSHLFTVAGDFNLTGALRAAGTAGTAGQFLTSNGSAAPSWTTAPRYVAAVLHASTTVPTTVFTGTTTFELTAAYQAQTWNGAKCKTDAGTADIQIGDGTNWSNTISLTTSVGSSTISSNNAFTASESRYVRVFNPASSPTVVRCTFLYE